MCRKLALAATALTLIAGAAWAAPQAPATTVQPAPATAAAQPAPAPPAKATPEQRAEAARMDPLSRAAFWAHAVDADPRDVDAGASLAKALRELSRFDDAASAADRVLIIDPNNLAALMEGARARIAANQGFYAIDLAQRAAAVAPRDWRPVSLLAIALEQSQREEDALAAHQRALALAPNNPGALSNLGMYYAAHGDSAQAEALLRRAVVQNGATAQIRQNLALILGLQGRLPEAEQLARQDLPPSVVANNLAYLRAAQAPANERSWDAMRGGQ